MFNKQYWKISAVIIAALFLASSAGAVGLDRGPEWAARHLAPHDPGTLLIKFREPIDSLAVTQILSAFDLKVKRNLNEIGWTSVRLPKDLTVASAMDLLLDDPLIEAVEPNFLREITSWEPNDWFWVRNHTWDLKVMNMAEAWGLDTTPPIAGGDPEVVVAIIDTGVCYTEATDTSYNPPVHYLQSPDFNGTNIWQNPGEAGGTAGVDDDGNGLIDDINGWDFGYNDNLPLDDEPHGTHVAGTIAQTTNNDGSSTESDYSAVGIAFNCSIMPVKVNTRGMGMMMDDLVAGILYAAVEGADVINMSLGGPCVGTSNYPDGSSAAEYDACQLAYTNGVVIVAATGNDADAEHPEPSCPNWSCSGVGPGFPGGYPMVMGIGASNNAATTGDPMTETRSAYSNYGYGVDVVAPAGDYYLGDLDDSGRDDLTWQQVPRLRDFGSGTVTEYKIAGYVGTSMASPHAAGLAALVLSEGLSHGTRYTPDQVRNKILYSAVDINQVTLPGYDVECGFGRIDAAAALQADPIPDFVSRGYAFTEVSGNGNYRAEPGETIDLMAHIKPIYADATNIQGVIESADPYITIVENTATFPNAAFNVLTTNETQPFRVTIGACPVNYVAQITLRVTCTEAPTRTLNWRITINQPHVMLVDDDRNAPTESNAWRDWQQQYAEALNDAGIPYRLWEIRPKPHCFSAVALPFEPSPWTSRLPTIDDLNGIDVLIWMMPAASEAGPTKREIRDIYWPLWTAFLIRGGGMFLTSDEYLYKMHTPASGEDTAEIAADTFTYQYLHVAAVEHDEYYYQVTGVGGDPITGNIGTAALTDVVSEYTNPANANQCSGYAWWPDNIMGLADAAPIFTSGPIALPPGFEANCGEEDTPDAMPMGACGVRYPLHADEQTPYRTVFMSFAFEGLSRTVRAELMGNIVEFLSDLSEPSTPTPSPTPTPTAGTTATPTPEPTSPPVELGVRLEMPSNMFSPGQTVFLKAHLDNPGPAATYQFVVLLDIGSGDFWFYPNWKHYPPDIDYETMSVPMGTTTVDVVPTFTWPTTGSVGQNIFFHGALLDMALTAIQGNFDSWQFGWDG